MASPRWSLLGVSILATATVGWLWFADVGLGARLDQARVGESAVGSGQALAYGTGRTPLEARTEVAPSPAASEGPLLSGPHGRVVLQDGRGLAAIDVSLWAGELRLAGTRTRSGGAFELPRPAQQGVEVRVSPDPRLHLDRPVRRLSPEQLRGEVALLFEGRAADKSLFRGLVIDARTREPLPEFRFRCWDTIGTDDQVLTDASGHFSTVQPYGVGRIGMWRTDFEGSLGRYGRAEHARESLDEESILEVLVGPTYTLAFQAPEGTVVTDFYAEVRDHRRAPRWYPGLFQRTRVRPGDPPWLRLHPSEVTAGPGPPWVLAIDSEDGLWSGEVQVESRIGRHPGVLPIAVERCGAIRGRIQSGDQGGSVACPLRVERVDALDCWSYSDAEGGFVLRGLTPGPVTLVVEAPGYEPYRRDLEVIRGEVLRPVVRLVREPSAGTLSGTISTESGAPIEGLRLELKGPGKRERSALVKWEQRDDGASGRFQIRLPAGEWRLRVMGELYGLDATPALVSAKPPAEGLHFTVHDSVARVDWRLEAVDAAGKPVPGARGWIRDGAGRTVFEGALFESGQVVTLADFPAERDLIWSVVAPGYRITSGDAADFVPSGEGRAARATLIPGWGAVIALVDRESGQPARGVALTLDGEATEPSDERGHLRVQRAGAPKVLGLKTPGWRLAEDNQQVDPATGRFASGAGGWSLGIYVQRTR